MLPIPFNPKLKIFNLCHLLGFGYHRSTDDYLVVSISYDSIINSSYLEFFSLRDSTWKQIDEGTNFPYMSANGDHIFGLLLNGSINWLAYRNDLGKRVIVAFDLIERKSLEMPLPDDFDGAAAYCNLWVFGECLSFWAMQEGTYKTEIWVMKQYKLHSSWTKTLIHDGIRTWCFYPICSTKSGGIVGTDGNLGLVKYNDKGQRLEGCSYFVYQNGFQIVMHLESLLSLLPDREQVDENDTNMKNEVLKYSPSPFS